jgi:hypothetical protein
MDVIYSGANLSYISVWMKKAFYFNAVGLFELIVYQ